MLRHLIFFGSTLFMLLGAVVPAEAQEQKRVLIVYAQDKWHPAHELTEKGIHSVLVENPTYDVQLFAEYLDLANFASRAQTQAAAEYIRKKYAGTQIDSIITVYDTAFYFMLNDGAPLFPGVPVIASQLPFDTGEKLNSSPFRRFTTGTIVGGDMAAHMQSVFNILPKTRHLALISGSSISDRDTEAVYRQEIERYHDRIALISLVGLTLEEILQRVATLPPDTVVLYGSMFEDAAGRMYVPREILPQISKASNAPVFGLVDSYLGFGIIGGSLFSFEEHGKEAARLLLRVLNGERPDTIPWSPGKPSVQSFDWAELQRWAIKRSSLPPDSKILNYSPSLWERYHEYILLAFALLILQSSFCIYLIHQRRQRQRTQQQLTHRLDFESMFSSLSARFVNLTPAELDTEIPRALEVVQGRLAVDRVSVYIICENTCKFQLLQSRTRPSRPESLAEVPFAQVPWLTQKIQAGEILSFSQLTDMPPEANADRNFLAALAVSSLAIIPLISRNRVLGVLSFGLLGGTRQWLPDELSQNRLIAEIFANAIMRRQQEEELAAAERKYRTVADFTYDWEYWQNLDGAFEYMSPSCHRVSGYTHSEFSANPTLVTEIIVPEDRGNWHEHFAKAQDNMQPHEIQFRIRRRDGQLRWIEHSCQPVTDDEGLLLGFRVSNRDVTQRKEAEIDLRNAYKEISRLKDQLEIEATYLQDEIRLEHNFDNIVGTSAPLKYALYKVEQIAATDTTVLVLGESGTGKELIARAIHNKSPRSARSLVKVNCATLPAHLIESELFGHERGAFTGAHDRQLGRFEVADGTTIFLDEIGELPLALQAKLLRVLQEKEFERLGSSRTIQVNVRVIAATNRDLETEVREGRFREDLFFRLNVFPITVPSLRQRVEDIPQLASFFVERLAKRLAKHVEKIPGSVIKQLKEYPWPGNVRELENIIERAVINSPGDTLLLAENLTVKPIDHNSTSMKSMEEVEREHLLRVLNHSKWRIEGDRGASRVLDINPSTLRSRMRKLGIQRPSH